MDFCDKQDVMERYCKEIGDLNRYADLSGVKMVWFAGTEGMGELAIDPKVLNINGDVHGGALFTLADTVANATAYVWGKQNLGEDIGCTTVSSAFNFLRPARGKEKLVCKAALRKIGNTIVVVESSVQDEAGKEVCFGTFTVYYIDNSRYHKNK